MSQVLERRPTMRPERWEPLAEFDQLPRRMREMLDQTFGGLGLPTQLLEQGSWSQLVDIEEQDDAYVLEVELPGVKKEDVNIEQVGSELVISGEFKERERKGIVRKKVRRSGRFDYRVVLAEPIDAEATEAKLSDGLLTLRVPKLQRSNRTRIEIKSS